MGVDIFRQKPVDVAVFNSGCGQWNLTIPAQKIFSNNSRKINFIFYSEVG
jgi:hypothetical protein